LKNEFSEELIVYFPLIRYGLHIKKGDTQRHRQQGDLRRLVGKIRGGGYTDRQKVISYAFLIFLKLGSGLEMVNTTDCS
jgi:hypothetical protein